MCPVITAIAGIVRWRGQSQGRQPLLAITGCSQLQLTAQDGAPFVNSKSSLWTWTGANFRHTRTVRL